MMLKYEMNIKLVTMYLSSIYKNIFQLSGYLGLFQRRLAIVCIMTHCPFLCQKHLLCKT